MKTKWILPSLLLLASLACSLVSTPPAAPPTFPPIAAPATVQPLPPTQPVFTAIPVPTDPPPTADIPTLVPTAGPLSAGLTLASIPFNESGANPPYTISALFPILQGSSDPRVLNFNVLLDQVVRQEIDSFRTGVLASASNPPIAAGSSFDLKFELAGQRGDIWSLKFQVMVYVDGAAHPGHYSRTLNYDLQNGREVALGDLFLSATPYLQAISDYCKPQLAARDIAFDMSNAGADPQPENYQRWNLSDAGLVITFDEYQVAPYAAGPQLVTIPFAQLQAITNPQGPLALFAH